MRDRIIHGVKRSHRFSFDRIVLQQAPTALLGLSGMFGRDYRTSKRQSSRRDGEIMSSPHVQLCLRFSAFSFRQAIVFFDVRITARELPEDVGKERPANKASTDLWNTCFPALRYPSCPNH